MRRGWAPGSDPLASTPLEQLKLIWERAGARPVEFDLRGRDTFTIGRDTSNAIVIASNFVSKTHAVLQHRDGRWLIEDQGSANGTRLNGAPIKVHAVTPGDVIEVGDQRLVLVDRSRRARTAVDDRPAAGAPSSAGAAGGLGKSVRLLLTALGTAAVMIGLLWMVVPRAGPPPSGPSAATPGRGGSSAVGPSAPALTVRGDSALVRRIEALAGSGVRVADALYDEGLAQFSGGRYREAAQLFAAALRHDPRHPSARARLEEAKLEWERAILEHLARAERAFGDLRYEDALLEWQQVLQLVDEGDPRRASAQAGIDRATRLQQQR